MSMPAMSVPMKPIAAVTLVDDRTPSPRSKREKLSAIDASADGVDLAVNTGRSRVVVQSATGPCIGSPVVVVPLARVTMWTPIDPPTLKEKSAMKKLRRITLAKPTFIPTRSNTTTNAIESRHVPGAEDDGGSARFAQGDSIELLWDAGEGVVYGIFAKGVRVFPNENILWMEPELPLEVEASSPKQRTTGRTAQTGAA